MSKTAFYIFILILLLIFAYPEIFLKFFLFGLVLILAILAFAGYKLNKLYKKFKEQNTQQSYDDQTGADTAAKDEKAKSSIASKDEFDMSKNNVIETEYEDV